MKNTKGKWEIENRSDKITQVISYDINTAEAKDICVVSDDWNEQVANANLIASAPELFKALKYINKECVKMNRGDYDETPEKINYVFSGIWKKAEEAIARAGGK